MFDWPARMKTLMPFGSSSQVVNWRLTPVPSDWPVPLVTPSMLTVYPVSMPSAEARVRVTLPPSLLSVTPVMAMVPPPS